MPCFFQCLLRQEKVWFVAPLQTTVFIFNFLTQTDPKSFIDSGLNVIDFINLLNYTILIIFEKMKVEIVIESLPMLFGVLKTDLLHLL
jgi:hypothetical protein